MPKSQAQLLQLCLQLLNLLRGPHHFILHLIPGDAAKQFPEKQLGLLVLVVIFDVPLYFFQQVYVWTEQIDYSLRSCYYFLFDDVMREVDQIEEMAVP